MKKIIFIAPMNMPIPSEKGAIEEIIWQTAKRLKRKYDVQIYNPLANSIIKKIIMVFH
ncbi:MAG: hypothetical protein QXL73_05845 [Thermoplasmata archaeon]